MCYDWAAIKNEDMAKYLRVKLYNWYVDDDRNSLVCTSEEKVKHVCKCFGASPRIVLSICIAFWYITLWGKFVHLSLENKTNEGTNKSQSKIIFRGLFEVFLRENVNNFPIRHNTSQTVEERMHYKTVFGYQLKCILWFVTRDTNMDNIS